MIFEIQFEINGKLNSEENSILVLKYPYTIEIKKSDNVSLISISEKISESSDCLPKLISNVTTQFILPKEDAYSDIYIVQL